MMKIGYFGKLPGYGDFIQRNVSPEFVKQWDNWLLKSIESSRTQLGEQWRGSYFNSPIWRFVISQKGFMVGFPFLSDCCAVASSVVDPEFIK